MLLQSDYRLNQQLEEEHLEVIIKSDIAYVINNPEEVSKRINNYVNKGALADESEFIDLDRKEEQEVILNLSLTTIVIYKMLAFETSVNGGLSGVDTLDGFIESVIKYLYSGDTNKNFEGPMVYVGGHYVGYVKALASWLLDRE